MSEANLNGEAGSPMESGLATPPAPDFTTAALQGSMQQLLSQNLGRFVVCEFLAGTNGRDTRAGILDFVGATYLVLYDDADQNHLICDTASLRFVTFSTPEQQQAEEPPSSQDAPAQPQPQANQSMPMEPVTGIRAVSAASQAKAAFNYTKRKSRR